MTEPDEQTAQWQQRLDREFPRGAVAAWLHPVTPGVSYQIPRILVLRVTGGQPVVLLPVLAGADKVLGPWQMETYERSGPRTGPRQVQVKFKEDGRSMTWSPRVSDRLARVMAPERQAFIQLAPQGGRAVLHTPEEL